MSAPRSAPLQIPALVDIVPGSLPLRGDRVVHLGVNHTIRFYEVLRNHPEFFVPDCKHIWLFDRYYERGLDWYLSFSAEIPAEAKAVGELSHD